MIPSLNDLRLVELEQLILHEAHDKDRLLRLRDRIEAEGEQRNPIIVSSQGDCCLVLGWAHLLDDIGLPDFRGVREVEVSERPRKRPLAEVETAGGRRVFLGSREEGLLAEVRALWVLQTLYPEGVVVRRVEPDAPFKMTEGEVMIRYRPFTPGELVEIVRSGAVLPAGITRFRVRERVLGVRYPLEKMKNGDAPARNAELKAFVGRLWRENRIRYYGEPVVLFE